MRHILIKNLSLHVASRGEKVNLGQREIALSISLLELSIKEQIAEQQEELYK